MTKNAHYKKKIRYNLEEINEKIPCIRLRLNGIFMVEWTSHFR